MDIVKKKVNETSFKYQDSTVDMKYADGKILINVTSSVGETAVEKPGEYEYSGVNLIAMEVLKEKHEARIDVLNISLENNIDTMFIFKDIEVDDNVKDKVKAINVFVTTIASVAFIKNIIKLFQPEKVIILEDETNKDDIEKLRAEYGKVEKMPTNKIKFKESEFNTEEDTIQEFFIL